MSHTNRSVMQVVLVEEEVQFTLLELSRACHADADQLAVLVDEGVLTPSGDRPQHWLFAGSNLRRARIALRLGRDLELTASGVALVLDLLDQIETLSSRLRRQGDRRS